MSFTATPPNTFSLSGGAFNGYFQIKQPPAPTSSYVKYDLYNTNGTLANAQNAIYFHIVSGNLRLNVQDAADTDTNYEPYTFSAAGSSTQVPAGQVTAGNQYDLFNYGTHMGRITVPTELAVSSSPANPTWSAGQSARHLQVQFTATQTTTYEFVEVSTGTAIVHDSIFYTTGGSKTHTFLADTNVKTNSTWYIRQYGASAGNYVGGAYASGYNATVAPQIANGSASNIYANTQGQVTFELKQAVNWYYLSGTADEWRVVAREIATNSETFSPSQSLNSNWVNHIQFTAFANNDTAKDFRVQIRNTSHGHGTFHDLESTNGNFTLNNPLPHSVTTTTWSGSGTATVQCAITQQNWTNQVVQLWVDGNVEASITNGSNGTLSHTVTTSGNRTYEIKVDGNSLPTASIYTSTYTVPPAGSVTINSTPAWTETGAGANGNSVSVTFNVSNTSSNHANFHLYKGNSSVNAQSVIAGNTNVQITMTDNQAGQSTYYKVIDHNNATLLPDFTTAATYVPPAGSLTINSTPAWTETGAGATGNSVSVTFNVSNNTNSSEIFHLRMGPNSTGPHWVDWVQVSAGSTVNITLTNANAGQSELYRLYTATLGYMSPTFTTAGTATPQQPQPQQPSVSYAPAKGGRKRRFPIISTQLFNRQRSIYSIGTTHHEIAPQF